MKVLSPAQQENRRALFQARARKVSQRCTRVVTDEYSGVVQACDHTTIDVEVWYRGNAAPYKFRLERCKVLNGESLQLKPGDHIQMKHTKGAYGRPTELMYVEIDIAAYAKRRADEFLQSGV